MLSNSDFASPRAFSKVLNLPSRFFAAPLSRFTLLVTEKLFLDLVLLLSLDAAAAAATVAIATVLLTLL